MPAFLNNSKVQIIFNEVPLIDEVINLTETSLALNMNTIFKDIRTGTGETKRPTYIPESGTTLESYVGFISTNYKTSFLADYVTVLPSGDLNFTLFTSSDSVGTGTGTVTIFANFENAVFTTSSNTTTAEIVITNKVPGIVPTATGNNTINLVWDGAIDDVGITGYQIQWKLATIPTAPWSSVISVAHDPTYGFNTIKSGGGFYNYTATQLVDHIFRIRTIDSIGQYSGYKEITVSVDNNTILISPISTTSQSLSCSAHPLVPTNPVLLTTPTIQLGITFVKNTNDTTFNGLQKYWRILLLGISYGCKIDYDGKIMEFSQCSLGGTGTIQSESMSSYGYPAASSTGSDICTGSANLNIYYYSPLAGGSIVYSTLEDDNTLSSPVLTVNNKYYIITDGLDTYIAKFASNGVVISIVSFSSVCPTTTTSTGTCCFVKGTKISMFDNTNKNIEDIEIGDIVVTYNEETKEQEPGEVTNIASPVKSNIIEYKLSNNTTIKSTTCHPYWVVNKGWSSFNPLLTKELYDFNVNQIEQSDILLTLDNKEVIVDKITELITKEVTTYNLEILGNHTYYANNILVHNKTAVPQAPNRYDEFGNETAAWSAWYDSYGTTPSCWSTP